MKMQNKYSDLSKNMFLFSLSSFLPKILGFLIIPMYTNCLTQAEYGIYDLIVATVQLLIPIFTVDIQDAILRFSLDKKTNSKSVFSVATKIIFVGAVLVSLGAGGMFFADIPSVRPLYLVFVVITFITTAMNNSFSMFCRGIDKVKVVVVSAIVESIVILFCNILFLLVFNFGLTGFLLANSLGAFCASICLFFGGKLYKFISFKIDRTVAKEMCSYSFPLVFSVLAWWVNNASDRYIVTWMSGVAASGLYAVAYKIPTILTAFQDVFHKSWSITVVKEFDEDKDTFISQMYNIYTVVFIILCSLLMIFNIPLAKIVYSKSFFSAWQFVPPLLVSVLFNSMALFLGTIFTTVKDTKTIAGSTVLGAIVNIVCNFVFIHFFGAYGAAIATLVSYLCVFIIRQIMVYKYIKLDVQWKKHLLSYSLLLVQMIVSYSGLSFLPIQLVLLLVIILIWHKELANQYVVIKKCLLSKIKKEV